VSREGAGTLAAADDLASPAGRIVSARGSDEADSEFERVFLGHYEGVLRLLLRVTGNRAQAEELANDVFWRLAQKSSMWLVTNNVGGWLYRTATRLGIDALRSSARRCKYEQAASDEIKTDLQAPGGGLSELLRDEERKRVRRALGSMKSVRAQILLMRAEGASYQEIADALHVRAGSVGTLLKRAEDEFRRRYLKEEKR
jgi:RNA polymerase sigma-70 factor (ECF subfamily)